MRSRKHSNVLINSQYAQGNLRDGITLIEVVVGLAMLGGMLSVMLIASGKLETQRRAAQDKAVAVEVLDQTLGQFFRDSVQISGPQQSIEIPGHPSWSLILSRRAWTERSDVFDIVRFAIRDADRNYLNLATAEVLVKR